MNGLFPFQSVGLVNLKHCLYGFEAVFLWFTAEISHLNEILSAHPHSREVPRRYEASSGAGEQCRRGCCWDIPSLFPYPIPSK